MEILTHSMLSDSWEKLLNDALQITTATPPLSISEGAVLYPEEHGIMVNASEQWAITEWIDL